MSSVRTVIFGLVACLTACNTPRSTKVPVHTDADEGTPGDLDLCFTSEQCPQGQACLLGSGCRDIICDATQDAQCLTTTLVRACHASGTYFEDRDCTQNRTCDDLTPLACIADQVCVPNSTRCIDPVQTELCNADGTAWQSGPNCEPDALGQSCIQDLCLTACEAAELSGSSVGCKYIGADLDNYVAPPADLTAFAFAFVVHNPHPSLAANVMVKSSAATLQTQSIAPLASHTFLFPQRELHNTGTGLRKLAYVIESNLPVVASQFNPLPLAFEQEGQATQYTASAGAMLLLPTYALATNYVALAWQQIPGPQNANWGGSLLAIAAVDVAVDVKVFSKVLRSAANNAPALSPSTGPQDFTTVHLEPFDVVQWVTQLVGQDFSGTRIEATGKVAVFAGNTCARIPNNTTGCDHLEEQLWGLELWNTSYVAAKSAHGESADVWRIVAAQDDTRVDFHPGTINGSVTVQAGESFNVTSALDFLITATKPVFVAQYFQGNAAMTLAPPIAQFNAAYAFVAPATYAHNFVSVLLTDASSELWLDGVLIEQEPEFIAQSDFAVLRLPVTEGAHAIESSAPFGLTVYGYGESDAHAAYAYPGGLNLLYRPE